MDLDSKISKWFDTKDPEDTLDYSFDFSDFMSADPDDQIISGQFYLDDSNLVLGDVTISPDYVLTAFISGGTDGQIYTLSGEIQTLKGRIVRRRAYLRVNYRS